MTKRGSGFEIAAWELWDVYSGFLAQLFVLQPSANF